MLYAFISDIHCDFISLELLLERLKSDGVDKIYCLGDIAGYGSNLTRTIKALEDYQVLSIRGNHDAYLIGEEPSIQRRSLDESIRKSRFSATRDDIRYIKLLPKSRVIPMHDFNVSLFHGDFESHERYLNESIAGDYVKQFRDDGRFVSDVYLFGHTHIPYIIKNNNFIVANPGSISYPREVEYPSYIIIEAKKTEISVLLKSMSGEKINEINLQIRDAK